MYAKCENVHGTRLSWRYAEIVDPDMLTVCWSLESGCSYVRECILVDGPVLVTAVSPSLTQ